MFHRTVLSVLTIVLLVSFIIAMHADLMEMTIVTKLCVGEGNKTVCNKSHSLGSMLLARKVNIDADHWSRILTVSTLAPSIVTILILSAVAEAIVSKEYIGLYVATVLAIQSLVYLTISVCKTSRIEHLFAGALLNTLFGDLPGAILFAWIFCSSVSDSNLTRSLIFVSVEGVMQFGKAAGRYSARYLPVCFPHVTYLFSITFALSLLVFALVLFMLPKFEEIVTWKHGLSAKKFYLDDKKGVLYSLLHPVAAIQNEYLAGILLTAFLSQLGNSLFGSVIVQFLLEPPFDLSFDASYLYLWNTTLIQGIFCIITAFTLIKLMVASDTTMILLSLSCSAFWMVLIAYNSSLVMLYVMSFCLGGFIPLAMALLYCIASKENGILNGHGILMFGLLGAVSLACQAILTYNSHIFIDANRKIYHPFTLIFAGVMQLIAFIVLGSISCTFQKPLVEVPHKEKKEETEREPLLEE